MENIYIFKKKAFYTLNNTSEDHKLLHHNSFFLSYTPSKIIVCLCVCVCVYECFFTYGVFLGVKAAAAPLHSAEDSGTDPGLPGLHHHNDLHAAEGNHTRTHWH